MASGVFSSVEGTSVFGYRQMHVCERLSQLHDLKKLDLTGRESVMGLMFPVGLRMAPSTTLIRGVDLR